MVEGNTSGRDRERSDNIAEMRFEGYLGAVGRPGPLRRRPLSTMQWSSAQGRIKDDISFARRSSDRSRHPLAPGSALALVIPALSDHAQAQGNLDASYTISFARIRVGDITATAVLGDS